MRAIWATFSRSAASAPPPAAPGPPSPVRAATTDSTRATADQSGRLCIDAWHLSSGCASAPPSAQAAEPSLGPPRGGSSADSSRVAAASVTSATSAVANCPARRVSRRSAAWENKERAGREPGGVCSKTWVGATGGGEGGGGGGGGNLRPNFHPGRGERRSKKLADPRGGGARAARVAAAPGDERGEQRALRRPDARRERVAVRGGARARAAERRGRRIVLSGVEVRERPHVRLAQVRPARAARARALQRADILVGK